MTSVAHTMSKKLLGSITILLVKFHWIETTLHHFECPTRHDYIQPKNILAPACVHYLKRIGIMQISLRYLLWNVRNNAAYSNVVVAVVDREQGEQGGFWQGKPVQEELPMVGIDSKKCKDCSVLSGEAIMHPLNGLLLSSSQEPSKCLFFIEGFSLPWRGLTNLQIYKDFSLWLRS